MKAKQSVSNTPKRTYIFKVESTLDPTAAMVQMVLIDGVVNVTNVTGEIALKAQVRKEIEELKKSAAISEIHWDDDQKTQRIIDRQKMYAHNQAITDCLSIPSLKGEE